MPDGNRYEFVGKTYYGNCATSGATQTKLVTVTGFTSTSLVDGVRVVVRFYYAQAYNGVPKLNVSSTGAKNIQSIAGVNAQQYEWASGQIVAFIYYNGYWVIEDGGHADNGYWGKAMLTNTISNVETMALTPKAVYDQGYVKASEMSQYVAGVSSIKGNAESTYRTGNVNLTAANIGAVATSGDETVAGNKNFTGSTTLASLTLGSETAITSWDGFTRQTATTTWTAPTVVSSQVTIQQGGYYTEGKHVYVQMEFKLASTLNADTTLSECLENFPLPALTVGVLSIETSTGAYGWAGVKTNGKLSLRLNKQVTNTASIYVTGTYTSA